MHAHGNLRKLAQNLHRLLIPGTGEHNRNGDGYVSFDELYYCHVHRMAHPKIVATDQQHCTFFLTRREGNLWLKISRNAKQKEE